MKSQTSPTLEVTGNIILDLVVPRRAKEQGAIHQWELLKHRQRSVAKGTVDHVPLAGAEGRQDKPAKQGREIIRWRNTEAIIRQQGAARSYCYWTDLKSKHYNDGDSNYKTKTAESHLFDFQLLSFSGIHSKTSSNQLQCRWVLGWSQWLSLIFLGKEEDWPIDCKSLQEEEAVHSWPGKAKPKRIVVSFFFLLLLQNNFSQWVFEFIWI